MSKPDVVAIELATQMRNCAGDMACLSRQIQRCVDDVQKTLDELFSKVTIQAEATQQHQPPEDWLRPDKAKRLADLLRAAAAHIPDSSLTGSIRQDIAAALEEAKL